MPTETENPNFKGALEVAHLGLLVEVLNEPHTAGRADMRLPVMAGYIFFVGLFLLATQGCKTTKTSKGTVMKTNF